MIPTDRYCHSGPGNGDNSILTKLSVMPFCRGTAVNAFTHMHILFRMNFDIQGRGLFFIQFSVSYNYVCLF